MRDKHFFVAMALFAVSVWFVLNHFDRAARAKHPTPHEEAQAWAMSLDIVPNKIVCTGTEEYHGNDSDAQCVVVETNCKRTVLDCPNVWTDRVGCKIASLER